MRPTLRRALGENNDEPLSGARIRKKKARCEAGLFDSGLLACTGHADNLTWGTRFACGQKTTR
jgi:hypothetical protein